MATFGDRLDELVGLLGISQNQFTARLGKTRSNYNYWKVGGGADFETVKAISVRWQVSIDSLLAMEGTEHLEPSPALRKVQEELLHTLSKRDMLGEPAKRVHHLFGVICNDRCMSEDAWCEWLQIASMEETVWTDDALERVAFLVGWYAEKDTWVVWLKTGQADVLDPLAHRQLQRMVEELARSGMTLDELRRRLMR